MFFNTHKITFLPLLLATYMVQLSLIINVNLVIPSQAATALEEIVENPEHPGKCYIQSTGVAYLLGESWQVPEMGCADATCYRSGSENKYLVAYQTCGLVSAEPGCRIVSDSSLPYPSCCPTIRCDSPLLNYDSVDYEPFDLQSINIASDELNEIDDWRSSDDVSQIDSIPSSSLSFEDQEKIVEELAKQPSKLFDILMNPQKLSDSLSPSKQKSGIYIDPLLVRLP